LMQDFYYSKALDKYFPTRLDYLLYAHDGRGLGHVSRTTAVGLALKRLYPESRILLITGSANTQVMVGRGSLDWIKLPSYQTILTGGKSEGRDGAAGFYKSVLGNLRAEMIADMVKVLRPRCLLVDHNPLGKRQELRQALDQSGVGDCRWVLGLRAIVGEDKAVWSPETAQIAGDYYLDVLWYGDSGVLGTAPMQRIADHFDRTPVEMGYVSRVRELAHLYEDDADGGENIGCTVSIPWFGPSTAALLSSLHDALAAMGDEWGRCHLYVEPSRSREVKELFKPLSHCRVEPIGDRYIGSLIKSKVALIYGGYNSILDVLALARPALVVLRATSDREQQEHLELLQRTVGTALQVIEEGAVSGRVLVEKLRLLLAERPGNSPAIDCSGAERTAAYLHGLVQEQE
jgi:predicted glycosyltransferase